jgi:hypothetical protein
MLHFPSPINVHTTPIKNIDLATIKLLIFIYGPGGRSDAAFGCVTVIDVYFQDNPY